MLLVEITYQFCRKYTGILVSYDSEAGLIRLGQVQEYIAEVENQQYDLIEIDITRVLKITSSPREE